MIALIPIVLSLLCLSNVHAQFSVDDLARLGEYESRHSSSFDRSGANGDYIHLKPGQTATLFDETTSAEIRSIWITIDSPEIYHLKKIILRMYWDDEESPSVEVPVGDFFGLGLGTYTTFQSALLAVAPDKALNAYFPMPFRKHGRITATNEGSQEVNAFYWNIEWIQKKALPEDTAYFHAQYRQCAPCNGWYKGNFYGNNFSEARQDERWKNVTGKDNYVILDAVGNGHFVGVTFSVFQNQWGGWNEGDEMIWLDGETQPRIHGTGGEDYFRGAWGFSSLYHHPLAGLTEFHHWEPGSRFSHYRWHLEAPVRFRKSVRVTIEDGHANLRSDNLYSVAYWYQMEPHKAMDPLPPVAARIPKFVSTGGPGQDPEMK